MKNLKTFLLTEITRDLEIRHLLVYKLYNIIYQVECQDDENFRFYIYVLLNKGNHVTCQIKIQVLSRIFYTVMSQSQGQS